MKKWEYCVVTEIWITTPYSTKFEFEFADPAGVPAEIVESVHEGMGLVQVLNLLGQHGWEAVTLDAETVENGTVTKVLFKRKVNNKNGSQ